MIMIREGCFFVLLFSAIFAVTRAGLPPQYGCQSVTCDELSNHFDPNNENAYAVLAEFIGMKHIGGGTSGGGYDVTVRECDGSVAGTECTECSFKETNTTLFCKNH